MPSSRWDRPPPPRDWRWVVGGVGRVLIATGLLMFGFVAYQLWGTGLEYAQAQDRLEDEFAALVADEAPAPGTTTAPSTTAPSTSAPTSTSAPGSTDSATTAPTTAPASTAPPVTVPAFSAGDVMAYIEIPAIDVGTYVVSGVQPDDLKKGPGHYPDTPQPGQLGNAAIAGHRTTYGQPFYRLDSVQPGDEIIVRTVQGRFVYRATGSEVVGPDRSDVVATADSTVARLTLTTCDPKYTARNRLVVYAELDGAASNAPPQEPIIETDRPVDSAPPASTDDPVVTSASAPGTTSSVASAPVASAPVASAPVATPPQPPAAASGELADAFAHGWFSDDAAFAQVALWGLIVTAVAVAAWRLSRRVRRNWVGALAGIVPFVLALYFLFQNINRLLPAAL